MIFNSSPLITTTMGTLFESIGLENSFANCFLADEAKPGTTAAPAATAAAVALAMTETLRNLRRDGGKFSFSSEEGLDMTANDKFWLYILMPELIPNL